MDRHEAEELLRQEGFKVKELIEEYDDAFFFSCEGNGDNAEIEVYVDAKGILIAPT